MALEVSQVKYLLGEGLLMEFGTISDFTWVNRQGKCGAVQRGEYNLYVFRCLWGIKRPNDKEFLVKSSMLDSYEDGLKYLQFKRPLYLCTIKKLDSLHWKFIMTESFMLYLELEEEPENGRPLFITDHNEHPVCFERFYQEVFLL